MTASFPGHDPGGIDLRSRQPTLDRSRLLDTLVPSARFAQTRFETYRPNPEFPSQEAARQSLQQFLEPQPPKKTGIWPFQKVVKPAGRGLYLDGGFGVGKTHLLASTYYAARERNPGSRVALMSFQDLMYLIGALKMPQAIEALRGYDLLLIDEFELDDPGNTHMANTLLEALIPAGVNVVATSNTAPGALGEGRFSTTDFQRQIEAIAGQFQSQRVDGPDYRHRGTAPEQPLSEAEFSQWLSRQPRESLSVITADELDGHLTVVHPSQFAALLEGVQAVAVTGLHPLSDQNSALRLVHFIDKVYDMGLHAAFTGTSLDTLFDESYRHGAFAKKYSRCLSRLSELLSEARQG
ncbi:cell division protein ZapE [Deinococcus piscis]|uniref:Cell division protein ZapE n=1 Tax=Deinococcus piscis TaxID=394230 RepID=A0ABQ3K2A0_9DEIO|nr:cell division protein ZapE [Deinococcus piscis]GHG00790.1 cell division protein ZapE [Deinococcus piscis]